MLPIVAPFISKGYMERLLECRTYWEDQDKIFCPIPTCSAYVPRDTYIIIREEEVIKERKEEKKPEEAKPEGESGAEGAKDDSTTNLEGTLKNEEPVKE